MPFCADTGTQFTLDLTQAGKFLQNGLKHTSLVFISEMALVASSGVDSCTKPTPRLIPVLPSRSTLHDMIVPNSCTSNGPGEQAL